MDKFYLIQVKRTNGTLEKGVVIKDTLDAASRATTHTSEHTLTATTRTLTM